MVVESCHQEFALSRKYPRASSGPSCTRNSPSLFPLEDRRGRLIRNRVIVRNGRLIGRPVQPSNSSFGIFPLAQNFTIKEAYQCPKKD